MKYQKGDCISIKYPEKKYLAGLITDIYKSYYDITLLEYFSTEKPKIEFINSSRFFGTKQDAPIISTVDKCMIAKKYIDKCINIGLICHIELIPEIIYASYHYEIDIEGIRKYYLGEIETRIEKTNNAEKFPDLGFYGRHLLPTKNLML